MKKLIITCTMVAVGAMASYAQGVAKGKAISNTPPTQQAAGQQQTANTAQVAEKRAKALQQKLGLNAAQYKTVYEAELDYANQDKVARENGGPGEGQAMQMQMGKDQRIKSVLTPAQNTKYDQMKPASSAPSGN